MNKIIQYITLILFFIMLTTPTLINFADDNAIYVSTDGNDNNTGTFHSPYKSIQYALDHATAGTTIYIREGNYYETLQIRHSGNKNDGHITLMPYRNEMVKIDGSKISSDERATNLIRIDGQSHITIEGLIFCDLNSEHSRGIYITDNSHHIYISNNEFYDINTSKLDKNNFGGANAISVKSYYEKYPIHNIYIYNNDIHDCTLGFSEAVVLSGNVYDFEIYNNKISDVTNIGIDIAGHYGHYHGNEHTNQARNGIIHHNTVQYCNSYHGAGSASGIYIDGGKKILIKDNVVSYSDYGITVGCETKDKKSYDIVIDNNTVFMNAKSGISIGGYNERSGYVRDCKVINNKTYKNNQLLTNRHAEINIKRCKNILIAHNILYGIADTINDEEQHKKTKKTYSYPIISNYLSASNIKFKTNICYSDLNLMKTSFLWHKKNKNYEEFLFNYAYDSPLIFLNPQYTNPELGNFKVHPIKKLIIKAIFKSKYIQTILNDYKYYHKWLSLSKYHFKFLNTINNQNKHHFLSFIKRKHKQHMIFLQN